MKTIWDGQSIYLDRILSFSIFIHGKRHECINTSGAILDMVKSVT